MERRPCTDGNGDGGSLGRAIPAAMRARDLKKERRLFTVQIG